MKDKAIRWMPVPDVPETPCGQMTFNYDMRDCVEGERPEYSLIIIAEFSTVIGGDRRNLLLEFMPSELFTFHDDMMGGDFVPKVTLEKDVLIKFRNHQYVFPLQEIENSTWLKSWPMISGEIPHSQRRHLRIVTMDQVLDIAVRGNVKAKWIEPKNAGPGN